MNSKYDFLIVGAGIFGCVFAREAATKGRKCLVIDKREHVAGNIYTEEIEGIQVHKYGAHIFHTSDREIWNYVQQFAEFNHYVNAPIAVYKNELYNMPFNMNTFSKMWNIRTPEEAKNIITEQRKEVKGTPSNLEEQAISLVGRDIYEKLVKGYTQKQWGRPCTELPAFIIKRLPVRFTFDNNYFNDLYQGIPIGGYTKMVEKMLDHPNIEVQLGKDFFSQKDEYLECADQVVYTGMIDEFYNYSEGILEYRSLRFETEIIDCDNYQGNAVINYTDYEVPYTRVIEHKHFEFGKHPKTVITREYSQKWKQGCEPYYPINDNKNNAIYQKYFEKAREEKKVVFGGRLGQYKYFDMHNVIAEALIMAEKML